MKWSVLLLFHFACCAAFGQSIASFPGLKKGDAFRKEVRVNSNAVLQEGVQVIDAGFRLVALHVYTVDTVTADGPVFSIRTTSVVDTVTSGGASEVYSTASSRHPNSIIEKRLLQFTNTPHAARGVEESREQPVGTAPNHDVLLRLAGVWEAYLYPDKGRPQLTIPFEKGFGIGYKWTHVDSSYDVRETTTYTLVSKGDKTATLEFISGGEGRGANTNSIGSLVFDTSTGLILERVTRSATAGYETVNGIQCAIDRKTAITERILRE